MICYLFGWWNISDWGCERMRLSHAGEEIPWRTVQGSTSNTGPGHSRKRSQSTGYLSAEVECWLDQQHDSVHSSKDNMWPSPFSPTHMLLLLSGRLFQYHEKLSSSHFIFISLCLHFNFTSFPLWALHLRYFTSHKLFLDASARIGF